MRRTLFSLLFLTASPLAAMACQSTERTGAPEVQIPGIDVCRSGYELLYRPEYKTAYWSAEHITAAEASGPEDRQGQFRPDPQINAPQAQLSDYAHSGYARGHLSPAGDFRSVPQEMTESFYLSNMIPQVQHCNNAGVWKQLEGIVRDWAIHYGELYVVTGPVYEGQPITIGNGVRVPDAMYKVIWNPALNQTIGFEIPNEEFCKSTAPQFVTPIEQIEIQTGIKFFPLINNSVESKGLWQ